jgi:hypothetical protein
MLNFKLVMLSKATNIFLVLVFSFIGQLVIAQPYKINLSFSNNISSKNYAVNFLVNDSSFNGTVNEPVSFLVIANNLSIKIWHNQNTIFNNNYNIYNDTTIIINVNPSVFNDSTIIVTGSNKNINANRMGVQGLSITQIKKLPVLLGEIDPLKSITLLPGIKSGGEVSGGVYVRGGGPDQNLFLLDGIPVYNPNHLLGFFSIFNGEAVKNIEVIKGNMPAEYGGRLSSVIQVETNDPSKTTTKVSGGIGLISSRLSVETPIVKNKSGISFSSRRTYIDQVVKPFAKKTIGGNGYFFYDLNGKADFILNNNNKIEATFYAGADDFTFISKADGPERSFNINWGNTLFGLSWKNNINKRLKHTTAFTYNNFNLDSKFGFSSLNFLFTSSVRDLQLKTDWTFEVNPQLTLKWGGNYIWHQFKPGAGGVTAGIQDFRIKVANQFAKEAAAYISAQYSVSKKLNVILGIRQSYFNQIGPTEKINYDVAGNPTDTTKFSKGQSVAAYTYPEPRINMLFNIDENSSLKASYTRAAQFLHLATTSGATFPSDLWLPSSALIKPGLANQFALGYFKNFDNNTYELSIETYYKTMSNQIEFKPGAQLLLNNNLDGEIVFGSGLAYGIEFFAQKKKGRLTGWIGYTLSRTTRTFKELNFGKAYPYRYDRTHDLSVVVNYPINKKWDFSGVFIYGTGNALTLPTGRFTYNIGINPTQQFPVATNINQYSAVNDYRLPANHRLDVSFNYTPKPKSTKKFKSSWNFSVYNLYNRYNPFFVYLNTKPLTQEIEGRKVFLFPILPSATWNFKF